MTKRWRPLSVRQGGTEATSSFDALSDGVPPWLLESLQHWLASNLSTSVGKYTNGMPMYQWSRSLLLGVERDLKITLPWTTGRSLGDVGKALLAKARGDEGLFLDLLDNVLWRLNARLSSGRSAASDLESLLVSGGSAWRVAERSGHYSLERRVDEAVVGAADEAMSSPRAGALLAAAWSSAYGRNPNPSDAYRNAIRAVETAAQPVITPKDRLATLGKMIAAMRAAPHKWSLVFSSHRDVDTVLKMFETLWKGQFDRHGTADTTIPVNVSLEEAQAAVHLAATLVQWFRSGAVAVQGP